MQFTRALSKALSMQRGFAQKWQIICLLGYLRWGIGWLRVMFLCLLLAIASCSFIGSKEAKPKRDSASSSIKSVQVKGKSGASFKRIPKPKKRSTPDISDKAKAEFAKALKLMRANKWKDAEAVLTLLSSTSPKLAGPYVNLGIVQAAQGKTREAESSWKKAISLNPTNFDAYTWLAVHYREQGRFKQAEKVYLSALEVWPHHPATIKNLGVLYDLYMGRLEAALKKYELYLLVVGREDKTVNGWVIDLNRRIKAQKRSNR